MRRASITWWIRTAGGARNPVGDALEFGRFDVILVVDGGGACCPTARGKPQTMTKISGPQWKLPLDSGGRNTASAYSWLLIRPELSPSTHLRTEQPRIRQRCASKSYSGSRPGPKSSGGRSLARVSESSICRLQCRYAFSKISEVLMMMLIRM
jgi:hypothetical protein